MTIQELREIRKILGPYKVRPDDVFVVRAPGDGIDRLRKEDYDSLVKEFFETESVEPIAPTQKDL